MTPIRTEWMNHTFTGPEGVSDLPVFKSGDNITSVWELSDLEMEEFLRTGWIAVTCKGFQPPMGVSTLMVGESKPMKSLAELQPGMRVRHKGTSHTYQITSNYGKSAIAVRTVLVTNPDEWEVAES